MDLRELLHSKEFFGMAEVMKPEIPLNDAIAGLVTVDSILGSIKKGYYINRDPEYLKRQKAYFILQAALWNDRGTRITLIAPKSEIESEEGPRMNPFSQNMVKFYFTAINGQPRTYSTDLGYLSWHVSTDARATFRLLKQQAGLEYEEEIPRTTEARLGFELEAIDQYVDDELEGYDVRGALRVRRRLVKEHKASARAK